MRWPFADRALASWGRRHHCGAGEAAHQQTSGAAALVAAHQPDHHSHHDHHDHHDHHLHGDNNHLSANNYSNNDAELGAHTRAGIQWQEAQHGRVRSMAAVPQRTKGGNRRDDATIRPSHGDNNHLSANNYSHYSNNDATIRPSHVTEQRPIKAPKVAKAAKAAKVPKIPLKYGKRPPPRLRLPLKGDLRLPPRLGLPLKR